MSEQNKAQPKGEVFALRPVPKEEQKSWLAIVFVQAGMVICIPAFLLGALLAEGMSTWMAFLAGAVGYLMMLLLTFILGIQGADLHMPTCAISQSTFGKAGTRLIVSSLFAVGLMGFFGLQVNVCGEAFSGLVSEAFNIEIPVVVSSVVWGIIMLVVAVFGMNALKNLDTFSVPLLLIIMIIGLVFAFRMYGTAGISENEVVSPTMGFAEGVGLSFSFFSAAAFQAADVTRFQRTRMDTVKSSIWGLMPAGLATLIIGILLTRVAGVYDITIILGTVGLPILGMIVLILASVTTNTINAYCGGLDLVMTFNLPDNRRREATAVIGIIGIVLGAAGILNFIEVYLNWISFLGAPIAGIMIADYWIVGRGKKENWHEREGINWPVIVATLISLGISLWIPFGVFNANGCIVAIIVYLIIERFFPSKSRPVKMSDVPDTKITNEEATH